MAMRRRGLAAALCGLCAVASCLQAPRRNVVASAPIRAAPLEDGSEAGFASWLGEELGGAPGRDAYGALYDEAAAVVVGWRRRFDGDPKLWRRLMKPRLVKELIECAPVVAAARDFVAARGPGGPKVTIVDLCSGKGYLSMLLSELLPADRVERIVAVDKAWPLCGGEVKPHHINWDHVYGSNAATGASYFDAWPIAITTSKADLKCPSTVRGLERAVFDRADGPLVVLAVHLCGTLSLRALDLFNGRNDVGLLVLKPCCLPPAIHAQRGDVFEVGGHAFDATDVASRGKFRGDEWIGPARSTLKPKFESWASHLYAGAAADTKRLETATVQTAGGFQNLYVYAERGPPTTALWAGVRARRPGRMPA